MFNLYQRNLQKKSTLLFFFFTPINAECINAKSGVTQFLWKRSNEFEKHENGIHAQCDPTANYFATEDTSEWKLILWLICPARGKISFLNFSQINFILKHVLFGALPPDPFPTDFHNSQWSLQLWTSNIEIKSKRWPSLTEFLYLNTISKASCTG